MLKIATRNLISDINRIDFFSNCGQPSSDSFGTRCNSIKEAFRYARSRQWEDLCQAFSNRIIVQRELLGVAGTWTDVMADQANELLQPALEKVGNFFTLQGEAWGLGAHVASQLFSAVKEQEYSEAFAPCFFLPVLLPIYRAGYYPCGWDGGKLPRNQLAGEDVHLPNGRVRVY